LDPDEWLLTGVALIAVSVGGIALLTASEAALSAVRRSRITQLVEEGNARATAVERLLEQSDRFRAATRLLVSLLISLALGLSVAVALLAVLPLATRETGPAALLRALPIAVTAVVLALALLLLLGQALPRALAIRRPERLALAWVGWWSLFAAAMSPLVWLGQAVGAYSARLVGAPAHPPARLATSEGEIKSIVEESAEQGLLHEEEREMIHSIFDFAETVVRKVMVPRIDVTCLEAGAPIRDGLDVILAEGHSRIPVYEETVDTIVGIVHAKDLLRPLVEGRTELALRDLMRPPFFVPEGKKVGELLREFKRSKNQLAIVVDEYGGTSGLVTVEDLLEEIVGDIQDEYDVEEPDVVVIDAHTSVLDARLSLDDVNDRLDLELPTDEYDTIGGFVFGILGRLPAQGDVVTWDGLEFGVEQADGHRIQKVRVTRREAQELEADEGTPLEAR
jgi:CBS domain containing-hemolysin-like protein